VLALDLDRGPRLARETFHCLWIGQGVRQQELERYALVQLQMGRGHDHAHPALAEHALDPELSGQNLAFVNLVRHSRAGLDQR